MPNPLVENLTNKLPVVLDFQYVVLDVNANSVKDLCKTGLLSFILAFDHKNHIESLSAIKTVYDGLTNDEKISATLWLRTTYVKKYPTKDVDEIIRLFEKGELVDMVYTIERLANQL